MEATKAFERFISKLVDIQEVIESCENILISDNPTQFVSDNTNFLTKSFLIGLCGYLETYLKEVLEVLLFDYNERLSNEQFPYNLIRWNIENKPNSPAKVNALLDKSKRRFEYLKIKLKKEDLDSFVSGNPFRTKELFQMFGINLDHCQYFGTKNQLLSNLTMFFFVFTTLFFRYRARLCASKMPCKNKK